MIPDFDPDRFGEEDEEWLVECPKCGGSGLDEISGWNCEYCEGDGYVEV